MSPNPDFRDWQGRWEGVRGRWHPRVVLGDKYYVARTTRSYYRTNCLAASVIMLQGT